MGFTLSFHCPRRRTECQENVIYAASLWTAGSLHSTDRKLIAERAATVPFTHCSRIATMLHFWSFSNWGKAPEEAHAEMCSLQCAEAAAKALNEYMVANYVQQFRLSRECGGSWTTQEREEQKSFEETEKRRRERDQKREREKERFERDLEQEKANEARRQAEAERQARVRKVELKKKVEEEKRQEEERKRKIERQLEAEKRKVQEAVEAEERRKIKEREAAARKEREAREMAERKEKPQRLAEEKKKREEREVEERKGREVEEAAKKEMARLKKKEEPERESRRESASGKLEREKSEDDRQKQVLAELKRSSQAPQTFQSLGAADSTSYEFPASRDEKKKTTTDSSAGASTSTKRGKKPVHIPFGGDDDDADLRLAFEESLESERERQRKVELEEAAIRRLLSATRVDPDIVGGQGPFTNRPTTAPATSSQSRGPLSAAASDTTKHGEAIEIPFDILSSITNSFSKNFQTGEDSFGNVFKAKINFAHLRDFNATVKIRHLPPWGSQTKGDFLREVLRTSALRHYAIAPIIGVSVQMKIQCIILPLMDTSVHDRVFSSAGSRHTSPFHCLDRINAALSLSDALIFLHSNSILHGNLSLHAMLIDPRGQMRLTDFGISRLASATNVAAPATTMTAGFIDPHFFSIDQFLPLHDFYAVGVIILQLLTGRHTVEGESTLVELLRSFLENPSSVRPHDLDATARWPLDAASFLISLASLSLGIRDVIVNDVYERTQRPRPAEVSASLLRIRTVLETTSTPHRDDQRGGSRSPDESDWKFVCQLCRAKPPQTRFVCSHVACCSDCSDFLQKTRGRCPVCHAPVSDARPA